MTRRFLTLCSLVALFVADCACSKTSPRPVEVSSPVRLPVPVQVTPEQVRGRAESSFERAIFYKPREDSMTGLEMTFAPLIVQEVDDGVGETDPSPFGVIVIAGVPRVDPNRPTLYAGTFTTQINGVDHDQVVYFWRYAHRPDDPEILSLEGRGVRITLGSDGFPLVWEALSTNTETRVLFVSESLEGAAAREFGGPLPGRRYAVERSLAKATNVVIARVLDDGPVPMGPYVYLNAPPQRAVTAVLCRCMPSQVSEFVDTRYYDFAPLEAIKDWGDTRSCIDPPPPRVHWGGTLSYWNLRIPWEEKPLEQLLRWPKL